MVPKYVIGYRIIADEERTDSTKKSQQENNIILKISSKSYFLVDITR